MSGLNAGAAAFVPRTSLQQPLGGSATPSRGAAEPVTSLQGDDGAADILEYLSGIYPQYSVAALHDIFIAHDGDLYGTLEMLAELESELQSSVVHNQKKKVPSTKQRLSSRIDDAAFPALGSGGTHQDFEPISRTWASLAAASRPTTVDVFPPSQTKPNAWGGTKLSAQTKAAPIWSSGIEKFETGTAVAAEYATRRAEASDLARLRNQYFMQATQAYQAGNKALAKELSSKGREAAERMQAAHAGAAEQLFEARNARVVVGGASSTGTGASTAITTLDLHGLHVSEAEAMVRRSLAQHRGGVVRLVVGEGRHSAGKKARLAPAIKSLLSELGVRWREPYAGLLELRV